MTARIYRFAPRPAVVVDRAEQHAQAHVAYVAACWRLWFSLWGIR